MHPRARPGVARLVCCFRICACVVCVLCVCCGEGGAAVALVDQLDDESIQALVSDIYFILLWGSLSYPSLAERSQRE